MAYRKHHILAETYLSYFSENNDGKNISTLHLKNEFKKTIQSYNSGDKPFWKQNFYNANDLGNSKSVELFLGKEIENFYPKLMKYLNTELNLESLEFKSLIFKWIFYSKLRSPIWREFIRSSNLLAEPSLQNEEVDLREIHMRFFTDKPTLEFYIQHYSENLIIKKWTIWIAHENDWMTSDNPGFSVDGKDFLKSRGNSDPNPLCYEIKYDTILYIPLSKRYCLEIFPYLEDDDIKRNFGNDPVKFSQANKKMISWVNYQTFQGACELILASKQSPLIPYETIIKTTLNET